MNHYEKTWTTTFSIQTNPLLHKADDDDDGKMHYNGDVFYATHPKKKKHLTSKFYSSLHHLERLLLSREGGRYVGWELLRYGNWSPCLSVLSGHDLHLRGVGMETCV